MPLLEVLHASGSLSSRESASHINGTTPSLKRVSILVDFPLAHMQTQDMIDETFDQVRYNIERYAQLIMNITSAAAKREMADMGYELQHVLAFDGLPQHFPSLTGGYPYVSVNAYSESEFLDRQGYPGWFPELGSKCRGPLTPNSKLKYVNSLGRQAFHKLGLDMRYYAKTWEFANQFWWNEKMWKDVRLPNLDCTHPTAGRTGFTCVYKFLLQAIVDGYYEAQREGGVTAP